MTCHNLIIQNTFPAVNRSVGVVGRVAAIESKMLQTTLKKLYFLTMYVPHL